MPAARRIKRVAAFRRMLFLREAQATLCCHPWVAVGGDPCSSYSQKAERHRPLCNGALSKFQYRLSALPAHETLSSVIYQKHGRGGLASLVGGSKCRGACAHLRADLGFAGGRLPHARLVPRCQVRHLGALERAVRARSGRLVRPQHVYPGPQPVRPPLQTYGHPTKVGFMEIQNRWKAENWDPEALMDLYVKAGAQATSSRWPTITTTQTATTPSTTPGTPCASAPSATSSAPGRRRRARAACASASATMRRTPGTGSRPPMATTPKGRSPASATTPTG